MNEVEKFISENRHQLGYIMQEVSNQWIKSDPSGALTVGTCNAFIKNYGDYHELLDKIKKSEKLLDEDFQLYSAWHMNLVEFTSWVNHEIDTLGYKEFDNKYPNFNSAYDGYLRIIKGECNGV